MNIVDSMTDNNADTDIGTSQLSLPQQGLTKLQPLAMLPPSMLPPSTLCSTDSDPDSRLRPIISAMYLMSNQPPEVWIGTIMGLGIQLRGFLFRVLLGIRTTSTKVLVERICRYAIQYRHAELLSLLDADVILDAWRGDHGYPVFIALLSRQRKLAARLIQAGANLRKYWGPRVLALAIEQGYDNLIPLMVQEGMDINASVEINSHKTTALMVAVARHKPKIAKLLIEMGADINCTVVVNLRSIGTSFDTLSRTRTALGIALTRGQLELAELLFSNGAQLNEFEISEPAVLLSRSTWTGTDVSLVKLMIEAGISLAGIYFPEECGTPLQVAIRSGSADMIRLLLARGAEVNSSASVMDCLLKTAIETCSFEVVLVLVEAGAIVNPPLLDLSALCARSYGTALGEAVGKGDCETVQLLLNHAANANAVQQVGQQRRQTELYAAVSRDSLPMTQLLLSAGALVNEKNEDLVEGKGWLEQTALHVAVRNKNVALVQALLQAGAEVDIPAACSGALGEYEISTFEIVAEIPDADVLRLLLKANSAMPGYSGVYALQTAVRVGDHRLVEALIRSGIDVNAIAPKGTKRPPLQIAVAHGFRDVVELLLSAGATVNYPSDGVSRTALQEAVKTGDRVLAQLLIDFGADANAPAARVDERTALQHAVLHNCEEIVRVLIQAGADVNEMGTAKPLWLATHAGYVQMVDLLLDFAAEVDPRTVQVPEAPTPLQAAAGSGSYDIVVRLLGAGAAVDEGATDSRGTALQAAARHGDIEIVQLLLRNGADVNRSSESASYGTALHEAVMQGHDDLARFLSNRGADLNKPGRVPGQNHFHGTPLQSALDNDNLNLAQWLVEAGARADVLTADTQDRRTPLEAAMEVNSDAAVRLVLLAGADVRLSGDYLLGGSYPPSHRCFGPALVAAVSWRNPDRVRDLLTAGADPDASALVISWQESIEGHLNPLQAAVANSDHEMIRILLHAGASPHIRTSFPYYEHGDKGDVCEGSLLAVAIRNRLSSTGIVKLLLDCGASIDIPASGNLGRTALQAAAERGDMELLQELIQHGADVNAPPSDTAGATALQLAARHGYAGIVSILLEAGADPFAAGAAAHGRTALEGAAENGRADLVQLLLNIGRVTGLRAASYRRARDLALNRFENVIADMIKTVMADAEAS